MARLLGDPAFAVTATVARAILGDPANRYTLKNEGSTDVYYRFDPRLLTSGMSGDAAALKTALCSKLSAGDAVVVGPGVTEVYLVCATAVTGTVSIMAGALSSDTTIGTVTGTFTAAAIGDTTDTPVADNTTEEGATARTGISLWKRVVNLLIAIYGLLEKATSPTTSVLYDGGGTANALQVAATSAIPAGAAVVSVGANNTIDLAAFFGTAAQSGKLTISEYSAATPTLATMIRQTSVDLGSSDLTRTVDRACVGLATGTEIYAKTPGRLAVSPGAHLTISLPASITGSAYVRYQLRGSV